MNRVNPKLRNFARHLIIHEAKILEPAGSHPPAAFPVVEKLRPHLAILMGRIGFRSLLARALALAGAEVPWLRNLHLKPDGMLPRVDELAAPVVPADRFEGQVVLVAQLLGLLVAFIGENLTFRLVAEALPKLPAGKKSFKL